MWTRPRPSLRPVTLLTGALASALALGVLAPASKSQPVHTSLSVAVEHSIRLPFTGSAQSVVIGNPAIADVTIVDSHTAYISGRGVGDTDVVILDQAGRVLFAGDILVMASQTGRLTVWSGPSRTDYSCAPICVATSHSDATGGAGGSSGGPSPAKPANPLGGLAAGSGI